MVGEDYVEKYDIVKVWLKNVWVNSWVLYIRPVDANDEFIDEIHNEIMDRERASIIWWHDNTNNGDETSFILGWSRNTVEWHGTVQIGWEWNVSSVENAVILGSANSSVETPNGVVMASDWWVVKWRDSTKIWWWWTIDESAYNSFAIAWWTDISAPWVFAVGDITAKRPNIVQLNLWQWLIVWWRKFNWSKKIQLSVHGALAVWIWQCTTNMKWAIYYVPAIASNWNPAYCLCACVTDTSEDALVWAVTWQALSNQPYCDPVCWWEGVLGQPQCWTRWFSSWHMVYEYWETEWRRWTNFCKDNYVPHDEYGNEPEFPERWGVTIWTCPWVAEWEEVECKAYRKKDPPQPAVCWRNAARYSYKSERFYGEWASDYCVWNSLNWDNLSENGRPHAYKVLTAQQVKDKEEVEYTTWLLWTEAVRQLNNSFPATWWRTYWICETTNSDNATVQWAETVMQKECFAERMDCNYCAKDGFPYCFDIDFSDECWTWTRWPCREWTDNSCREPLYRNWNQTEHADSLYSAWATFTKVEIKDSWITGVVYNSGHNMFEYYMLPNLTSSIRTWVVHMEATDPSYCKSWDVCIVQCPYEYEWDDWSMSCKKDRPQNAIVNFHCNGWVAHMDNGTAVWELMWSQEFATWVAKKLKKNNCTKDGYFFLWWSTNSWASVPEWEDEEERTFSEPITEWLYAVWERDTRYTVKFDCGDKADSEQKMEDQIMRAWVREKLHKSICTDTWYVTIWWNKKSGQVVAEYWDEEEVVDLTGVGGTITLYAAWQRLNEVYYNCNGWEWYTEEQYYKSWESKALSANGCIMTWYTFSWWNTNKAWTGTSYTDKQVIKFNEWWKKLFLYAMWSGNAAVSSEQYTITYDCNWWKPTATYTQSVTWWVETALESTHCGNKWYYFKWWTKTKTSKDVDYMDQAKVTLNADLKLYAVWEVDPWCNMQNFTFNEITIANPNNSSEKITIMDRNLWATSAWTTCTEDNLSTCWCTFQWWNNYGFPSYWPIPYVSVKEANVDATKYGPENPYNSWTFILSPGAQDWAATWNNYLWWGREETSVDGRYPISYAAFISNASAKNRKWPCPEWWHVPSAGELWRLVDYWAQLYTGSQWWSFNEYLWKPVELGYWKLNWELPQAAGYRNEWEQNFAIDLANYFKMPFTAWRWLINWGVTTHFGNGTLLWSSTSEGYYGLPLEISSLSNSSEYDYLVQIYGYTPKAKRWWYNVRCFKNPPETPCSEYPPVTITDTSEWVKVSQWTDTIVVAKNDVSWPHFQWWNNYWFWESFYTFRWPIAVWIIPYSFDQFTYPYIGGFEIDYDWTDPQKDALRWWQWDATYNKYGWDTKLTTQLSRKWPCPEWWHVPAYWEWRRLIQMWNNKYACSDDMDFVVKDTPSFNAKFSLNISSYIDYWATLRKNWNGWYWTSSPKWRESMLYYTLSRSMVKNYRTYWYGVRCFKNYDDEWGWWGWGTICWTTSRQGWGNRSYATAPSSNLCVAWATHSNPALSNDSDYETPMYNYDVVTVWAWNCSKWWTTERCEAGYNWENVAIDCGEWCAPNGAYCIKTCFTAWTKVTMADWTQKNIEEIKIWERLLSASWTNTVLWYYRPKLWNRHLWSINWWEYFVSDEHPFMTTEWWKSFNPEMTKMEVDLDVTELKVWDILVKDNGYERIETIDYIDSDYNTQLYNFVLDGDHTYYADGYLVHNKQHSYQSVEGRVPDEFDSCPRNTSFAIAWDRLCCPSTNYYYGDGAACLLLCTNEDRYH